MTNKQEGGSDKLLPCPFCGGPGAIAPMVWTPGFHTVGCPTCRMWTRTVIDGRGRHGTREELIAVWNRRAKQEGVEDGE
jgi:hypothetical protein